MIAFVRYSGGGRTVSLWSWQSDSSGDEMPDYDEMKTQGNLHRKRNHTSHSSHQGTEQTYDHVECKIRYRFELTFPFFPSIVKFDESIVGFHMTSLKFKLKNYPSYRDFTFTTH